MIRLRQQRSHLQEISNAGPQYANFPELTPH